ncbi:MAG: hypothetical protein ABEH64_12130 [Salinirussus sp.]
MSAETVTHHEFMDGVHVEVIIDNGDGDVTVESAEFDFITDDGTELAPKGAIPSEHVDRIRQHLEENGYSTRQEPPTA